MGQEEVKKTLKQSGSWLMSNEIAKNTGSSLKSIQSSLRRLVKWGEIKKEPATKVIQDSGRLKEKSFAGYAYKIKDFKTLDDFKFNDKTVLLRLDLNSELTPFTPAENFSSYLPTILELLEKKAKIIILSHQVSKEKKEIESLKPHADYLSSKLNREVQYIDNILSPEVQEKIKSLKSGEILMLKNLFSLPDELKMKIKKQKKLKLIKFLAPLADFYVNDAFSLAHLSYASITGFPQVMPSCVGRYFEKEIEYANHLLNPTKPCIYILGGNKPYSLLPLIKNSIEKDRVNTILTSGLLSHLLHLSKGQKLGSQENLLKQNKIKVNSDSKKILRNSNILLPTDYVISTFGVKENIHLKHLPVYQNLQEIGKETLEQYLGILKNAKTIFIKGPLGKIEESSFENSTKTLLEEISKSDAFVFALGNSTVDAFKQFNIPIKNVNHLSKNTDALITYLSQEKLPALEILKIK